MPRRRKDANGHSAGSEEIISVDSKNAKRNIQQLQKLPDPPPKKRGRPPLTPEARRSRKRLNALMHGIQSNIPVIPGMEDEGEYLLHRDGVIESLQPEGYFENLLAEEIAIIFWKRRRLLRYEVASTMLRIDHTVVDMAIANAYAARTLAKGEFEDPDPDLLEERRETRMLLSEDAGQRLMKEYRSLHRQWVQTLHELQALQAHRRGHGLPPIRMSVS
jgi:hypothetical protein